MTKDGLAEASTPLIFGHRGAAGLAPENTLPSFAKALALGVDGVELDVYSAHGQLWVIHDETLDRTTNARGHLDDHSNAQLMRVDAGNGASIPRIADVLALVPEQVQVNIELKGPNTAWPAWQATAALNQERLLVSSFDHGQLRQYRELGGEARIGVLLDQWENSGVETALALDAWSIHLAKRITTAARVRRIHEAGFKVLVYTVNYLRSARKLQRFGVDGLFTDRPDRISRAALADLTHGVNRSADQ